MFSFTTLPPLSLYIHIPWCVRKCPYCDFNSHAVKGPLDEFRFVDAVLADLEQELADVWGRRVLSIFIGGGTPSLFSAEAIDRLLAGLRARLNISPDAEITLEANPGTVETQKFADFRGAGVNRLSIGIQSFNDAHLARLGRIHGRAEALAAAEVAHSAGFDNFNLDLMFGLPGQGLEDALGELRTAIELAPSHLSFYQLTIEPNTYFHARPPVLPEDDDIWAMYVEGRAMLAASGYDQYEVSAYARAGRQCRHNRNYWTFGDYIGVGAGAHGKITSAFGQHITRRWKVRHPSDYLEKASAPARIGDEFRLTPQDTVFEFMLNALRLTGGFEVALFSAHTGLPFSSVAPLVERAVAEGFLAWRDADTIIAPTDKGRLFLNDLLELFLPE